MFRMTRLTVFAFAIAAMLWLPRAVKAQLVVGPLDGAESLYFLDLSTNPAGITEIFDLENTDIVADGIYGVSVDNANRTIYFNVGDFPLSELYSVHYDDPAMDFSGALRPRKVADLRYQDSQIINGLAFDSNTGTLYGVDDFQSTTGGGPEGIYSINLATGETTLVVDLSVGSYFNWQIRGIDFNPVDNLLYAVNVDSTPNGIGLFSIDVNGAGTISPVVTLTGTNKTGLAIGDNKAYIVPDDGPNDIEVYNLGTGLFETPITGVPWNSSELDNGAGWAPDFPVSGPLPGANFCTDLTADIGAGLDVEAGGGQINYTITNSNCGPDAATSGGYSIVLSGSAAATATISNIASSSGTAAEGPTGTISGNLTPAPFTATDVVTFTVTTGSPGDLTVTVDWNPDSGSTDPYLGNNTASISHNVRIFPPAKAIASTVSGKSSALAPELGGAEYDSSLGRAYRSPDGTRISFKASTDFGASTTADDVIVRYDNGVGALVSQEDVSFIGTELDDVFNEKLSVNNDGYIGYIADATGTDDEYAVVALDTLTRSFAAREDVVIPVSPFQENGWDYGFTLHSANITGDNQISYCSEFMGGGIASTENTAVFVANADGTNTRLVAWEGNTIPTNQAGGATNAWENFDDGDQWSDGAGCQYLLYGDLVGSSGDDVMVVNNEVIFQEGETIAGTTLTGTLPSPGSTSGVIFAEMLSSGDWLAHGTTSDSDQDWVIGGNGSTYSVIARHGDEIYPGANEFWSDVDGFSPTFRAVAGNNQGDVAIMGRTTEPNTGKNMVVVLNGTNEVIREGDPVALDSDGLFDDNVFVGLPESDEMILTDGGQLIFTTQLVNADGSDTGNDAIVTVDVSSLVSAPLTGADLLVTKTASTGFIDAVGAPITYTITVCNSGPDDATGVMVNDTLPAEVTFSSATMGAMEVTPGMVEANLGSIPAYTSTSFQIVVHSSAEGTAVNTASVSANESDPHAGNNSGSAATIIENQVDVGVTKIDNGGAPVGQNYDYTVTVTNAGPAPATNVVVSDNLPDEVTYVSCSLTDTNPDPDIVDVTIPMIPVGGQVVYTITVTADLQALITNNISIVSLNEVDTNAANDSFSLDTINGDVSDLSVTKTDSGLANLGQDVTYTIEVSNGGPQTATSVVLTETLPAGVDLVSVSVPYNEVAPGVLEISYASIPNGGSEQFTVVVTPQAEGTYINTVMVGGDQVDPDDGNNTAITSTRVGNFRDMTIIYSEIDGHPTALVPGALDLTGTPVVTEWKTLEDMAVSPDGTTWMVKGRSEDGGDTEIAMVLGSGLVGNMLAQEGQPIPGEAAGTLYDFFDSEFAFNASNQVAFGARSRGTSATELLLRTVAGAPSVAVRETDAANGIVDPNGAGGDETMGNSMNTAHLLNDGSIGFYAGNIQGIATPDSNFDTALFYWDSMSGAVAFMQEGVSTIAGENVFSFVSGDFTTAPNGAHYAAELTLGDDFLTDEETLVVDGNIEVRQNTNFMGTDIDAIFRVTMAPSGIWYARGDQPSNDDWAISNGALIAKTGDSIIGGAESWGDAFNSFTGDSDGNYVITGNTSEPDENFNAVIALNGTYVVAREGDPIDLDGNGMYDDNVFIGRGSNTVNPFHSNDIYLTDDGVLYFFADLRDGEGNDLGNSFGGGGAAFITMDVSDLLSAGCPTIAGDVDGDGDGDGDDVQGAVTCILTDGASGGACACIDYNNNGSPDVGDIVDFVADLLDN